jgi:hypothetical protein
MRETNHNYKDLENCPGPDSFVSKEEGFEDLSKGRPKPATSKVTDEGSYNNDETDCDIFLKDPLF